MAKIQRLERNAIFSRLFGGNIIRARHAVAERLIKWHIGPDVLTIMGTAVTLAASAMLALGAGDKIGSPTEPYRSYYGLFAGLLLILASAFDMLDGAVAKKAGQTTKKGALLDSCCDRIADAAMFIGILVYFTRNNQIPHFELFAVLTAIAMANAQIFSYCKARTENFIDFCGVGYWQRGERMVAIFLGAFSGHMATSMAMLAVLGGLSVARRMVFGYMQVSRSERGIKLIDGRAEPTGIMKLALWRYRRGTLQYDIVTAINIAAILFIDLQRIG